MVSDGIDDATAENASHAESARAKAWTEELEVAGDQLIALVKRLAAEGRVRRIRLVAPDGGIVLDIPLPSAPWQAAPSSSPRPCSRYSARSRHSSRR